ncbi:MAG: hypothetical protein JKY87_00830 [Mariprofundus sp.]|nr:hypothetical protein [Mariprofundus sp.]
MLIEPNSYLFAYAITRDFGFAPNPFHRLCTLATCKPGIRKSAKVGDWILGVGGCNIAKVKRKCILLMKVTEKCSFQEYWDNHRYSLKKPTRNGSRVQMLGDNIYHKDDSGGWIQEDSHHSNPDGSANDENLTRDTKSDMVLASDFFLYFGDAAIPIDLDSIGYHHKIRSYIKVNLNESGNGRTLVTSAINTNRSILNMVISDPCKFLDSHKRVDQKSGKIL